MIIVNSGEVVTVSEQTFELGFVLEDPSGRSVEDLAETFYGTFDGVIAERDHELHVVVRLTGENGLSTALDGVVQLEERLGVHVSSIDRDLVDMGEVAVRMGVTRANVHQLVTGQRGAGGFPAPVGSPGGRRVWEWASVNEWIRVRRTDRWQGFRSLTCNDLRHLDAWLTERQELESGSYTGAVGGSAAQQAKLFLHVGGNGIPFEGSVAGQQTSASSRIRVASSGW